MREERGERTAELSLAKSQRSPVLFVDGRRINKACFEPTKLIFFLSFNVALIKHGLQPLLAVFYLSFFLLTFKLHGCM